MIMKLDSRFKKNVKGAFEKYEFQVGILDDGPHKAPKSKSQGLSAYAGGPVRKKKSISYGQDISDVSGHFSKYLGFNYLTAPFRQKNSDIVKFSTEFFKYIFQPTASGIRRLENLLQAIVRNPILRGDYGNNSAKTKKVKGFDRLGIDTAQLFKAIKAKVVTKNV